MRKLPLYLILVFAIVLAACGQATPGAQQSAVATPSTVAPATAMALATEVSQTAVVQNPSVEPTDTQAVQPTDTQPASQAPTATGQPSSTTMECQVVSLSPTQGPTEVSMFPPLSKDDYVLGSNPKAELTIIEYSDFQ